MTTKYGICIVPAAPVRSEDSHRSEMTSQLLFGDAVEILEEKNEWLKVKGLFDGYEGWTTDHMIRITDSATTPGMPWYITTDLLNPLKTGSGVMQLPQGCFLPGFDASSRELWETDLIFEGKAKKIEGEAISSDVLATGMGWLNAPYLWGGKTILGVDCSGFVQTVFRIHGINLLRDAWQQAEQGMNVNGLAETKEGDLAFFQNEKGRITHVGIVMKDHNILHASGKVRIDSLDQEGIVRREDAKRTHFIHSYRRVLLPG